MGWIFGLDGIVGVPDSRVGDGIALVLVVMAKKEKRFVG